MDQGARPARRRPRCPNVAARREVGEAALRPRLRPAVGGVRGPRASRSTCTAAPARPTTASTPSMPMLYDHRGAASTRSARSCTCCSSGVFERFPRLKFVMTEIGCAWVPPLLAQLDDDHRQRARHGRDRRARATPTRHVLPRSATEYFHQNVLDRREPARPGRRRGAHDASAPTASCGAATTRTTRAPYPFTREHLRQRVPRRRPDDELQQHPRRQRGQALRLRPRRARARSPTQFGPTVDELAEPLTELPAEPNAALLKAIPSIPA